MARFCNLWPASFDVLCIFIEEKKAIQLVNAGVIVQTVLLSFFFSVFIFSMPSKVIIIVVEFMFLGINTVCFGAFSVSFYPSPSSLG